MNEAEITLPYCNRVI